MIANCLKNIAFRHRPGPILDIGVALYRFYDVGRAMATPFQSNSINRIETGLNGRIPRTPLMPDCFNC
jgi:hypothetical protein